jgi:hypothetical protein
MAIHGRRASHDWPPMTEGAPCRTMSRAGSVRQSAGTWPGAARSSRSACSQSSRSHPSADPRASYSSNARREMASRHTSVASGISLDETDKEVERVAGDRFITSPLYRHTGRQCFTVLWCTIQSVRGSDISDFAQGPCHGHMRRSAVNGDGREARRGTVATSPVDRNEKPAAQ